MTNVECRVLRLTGTASTCAWLVRTAGPPDPQRPGGARWCVSPARSPPGKAAAGGGPPAVRTSVLTATSERTHSPLDIRHSTFVTRHSLVGFTTESTHPGRDRMSVLYRPT